MGFASIDAMVKAYTAGRKQEWTFNKDGQATNETPEQAGAWVSMYLAVGSPGAGTAPSTSWADYDNGAGGMTFVDVSPQKRYVYGVEINATVDGTLLIYDRLGHINLNANSLVSTGNKTITAVLPARYSSADTNDKANIEAWVEVTEVTATTTTVLSMNSYTNEGGTTGRAGGSLTFPATTTNVGWMAPLPLQAGDKGVSAIATINVSVASTTTGEINVVLLRPIARVGVRANVATLVTVRDGLPPRRIYDDSSLCMAWFASSTTVPDIQGSLITVYDGS
jgi:hypothetical protein